MRKFRFEPVKWLTTVSAVLVIATGATQTPPFDHVHWIAAGTPYLAGATAVVTAILGALARSKVTPLARPQTADGRALVAPSRFE